MDNPVLRDEEGNPLELEPAFEAHYLDPNNPTSIIWYYEY